MRALARHLRAALRNDERGVALVVVIGIGMVMLALVATALTAASSGLRRADTDQDINGAVDAAYAAVEEYQSRLAIDNSYFTFGNPAAPFSVLSGSTKLVLPTGTATNPAFGIGATGSWAVVPGSSPVASFRYEVDSSKYSASGSIRIRATGRVGDTTRSIVADLKQSGFIDYLYFTDYEVQDPQLTNQSYCNKHIWENRDSRCTSIRFGNTDTIDGPVHSNDTLTVCGTTFKGKVTSSNTKTPMAIRPSDCNSTATYPDNKTEPYYQAPITMPPTNAEMKKETRNDLPTEVALPGCLYTGPTVITFTSDGKMNVKSPWTRKTNIAATAAGASNPAQCGTPGTGTNGLGSAGGATIDVLASNVIYVQNVPTVSGDPNNPATSPTWASGVTCGNSDAGGWSMGSGSNITRYPVTDEITPDGSDATNPAYGCKNGDVYVKGTFKGAMTIAAENYVYVTGDLKYSDPAKDIIGLVGNGAVWVWNPMKSVTSGNWWNQTTTTKPLLTDASSGRTIQAAILSVAHTFQVQNYNQGGDARGTLTVKGSIAQAFRGPVGLVGGSGYIKAYKYDTRFAYMAPPKFLSPVSSSYGVSQYAGVAAAFNAAGVAQ
jgi:hypothetical protein